MSQDQLIALVALLLALVLAVMRLRGELGARRQRNDHQQQNRPSTPQPPVTSPDDVERLR